MLVKIETMAFGNKYYFLTEQKLLILRHRSVYYSEEQHLFERRLSDLYSKLEYFFLFFFLFFQFYASLEVICVCGGVSLTKTISWRSSRQSHIVDGAAGELEWQPTYYWNSWEYRGFDICLDSHDRHFNGIDMSRQEEGLSGARLTISQPPASTSSASNGKNTRNSSFLRRGNSRRHRKLVDILSTEPSIAVRLSCHGARTSSQARPPRTGASLNMMDLLHTILLEVRANTTAIGLFSLRVESLE